MDRLKVFLLKLFLVYENKFPVDRGKFTLSRMLTSLVGEVNIKTACGIWLRIIPSSPMDRSYLGHHNKSHEVIISEINKLREGDVFVDIGSNIGYYTFSAAMKIGDNGLVYSFEPSKREFLRLLHGLDLNHISNVLTFHCALSDHNGMLKFGVDKYHTGLNRIEDGIQPAERSFIVPVFRGDYIINSPTIALLKVDVEGAEFQVLSGLKKKLEKREILKLIVEITPSFLEKYNTTKSELYSYMMDLNYTPLVNSEEWQYDEIFVVNGIN